MYDVHIHDNKNELCKNTHVSYKKQLRINL